MVHSARDRPLITSVFNNYEGGEVNMRTPYQNELYHYGIPGMKWGIRRYQNPDGTLTAAGKRRYGTVENLERGMTKKQAAEHDEAKRAAINSGKTSEVQKYSSELTREEMAHAVQRIRDEQTLSDLRAKDVAAGQQKVKAIIDAGGQLKTAGETVKNVYNLVAQANNAFNKENKLPIIGNDQNNKKPGEKSIDQQTKEFALERMKIKAAREDADHAAQQSKSDATAGDGGTRTQTKSSSTGDAPTYSQPSQERRSAEKKTTEIPTYSQPSQASVNAANKTIRDFGSSLISSIGKNLDESNDWVRRKYGV